MPQGKKKLPFSGKAKREQLKHKKNKSKVQFTEQNSVQEVEKISEIEKINQQPQTSTRRDHLNRYTLQFFADSLAEIKQNKEKSREAIVPVGEKILEISADTFFPEILNFPTRPPWNYEMSPQELDLREQRYFNEYLMSLEKDENWRNISYFELNLETWRQLWRVLEMSDIILFIVDIRYAGVMFPPSLYRHVKLVLHKEIILVLNKIDLASPTLIAAWKNYFKEQYPELHIILFTTLPGYSLRDKDKGLTKGLQVRRRKGRVRMAAEGAQLLLETCEKIVENVVDLSSWRKKIQDELATYEDDESSTDIGNIYRVDKVDTRYFKHEKYRNGILTIGCVGQPNVGKSSVMNAIMGKKVVSVSKTPGHTKHFQTIFLTPCVRLCDCPGLVFPSQVPKPLQVIMGSYPIAQLRDPYTAIRYLAERIDLISLLKLKHPNDEDIWSTMDICEAWAQKRGFITAKAARLDTYRAANNLLRMAVEGKICLCLYPPDYVSRKDEFTFHPDCVIAQWVQADEQKNSENTQNSQYDSTESSESDLNELGSKILMIKEAEDKSDSDESEEELLDEDLNIDTVNKFDLLADK